MKRCTYSESSQSSNSIPAQMAKLFSALAFLTKRATIIMLLATLTPCGIAQGQVYVDIDRSPGGDGATWGTAFRSIQTGVDTAVTSGIAEIWVAEGTYAEALTLASGLSIYGGFVGNEGDLAERSSATSATIVNSSGATHAITADSVTSMTLDSFAITGGSASGAGADGMGAGLYFLNVDDSNTITNCWIAVNHANFGGGAYLDADVQATFDSCTFAHNSAITEGAGLYIKGAPLFLDCLIFGNIAGSGAGGGNGGGAYCAPNSAATFLNCTINANGVISSEDLTGGGGIFSNAANTLLSSCTLSGNTSGVGGGGIFFFEDAATTAVNCIISGNHADDAGGGIVIRKSNAAIINCAVMDNDINTTNAGGISIINECSSLITNVIFSGNGAFAIREQSSLSEPTIINCIFWDNPDGNFYDFTSGSLNTALELANWADPTTQTIGNLVADPQLKSNITGVWTDMSIDEVTSSTTFTDSLASFTDGALVGTMLNNNTSQSLQSTITSNTMLTITVVGNFSSISDIGDTYELIDYNPASVSSPLIDSGASLSAPDFDFDGVSRPVDIQGVGAEETGLEYDIGPYEFHYPEVALSSTAGDPTAVSPIPVTALFDEDIIGFVGADLITTNCTVQNFVRVDARTFTFGLVPSIQAVVEATVPAGVCTDTGGNPNVASNIVSRNYDTVMPNPSLSTAANNPTSLTLIPITAFFDEAVKGFIITDLVTTNCTVQSFIEVTSQTFTFDLSPVGQGLVEVAIPGGVCADIGDNANTPSAVLSRTFDSIAPGVTMSSTADEPTNVSPITVAVSFDKDVTGFTIADITPGNATVGNFATSSAQAYSFDLIPTGQGTVTADIASGAAFDVAFNPNTAAAQFTRTFDTAAPTVSMSSGSSASTNNSPILVAVDFNEDVTGFTIGDITPGNATVDNFSISSARRYLFELTPAGPGAVTADIAGGAATDSTGNGSEAAAQFSRIFDNTLPTVTMSSTADQPTSVSPIIVSVSFNEDVFGFASDDITPGNATISSFQTFTARSYQFALTPMDQGMVTANIDAGVATDVAGNPNLAASQLSRNYDSSSPTVTLSTASENPTNNSPIPVTAQFDEIISDFELSDIITTNCTVQNFTEVTSQTFTFDLAPIIQGQLEAAIPAGSCLDITSNPNTASATFSHTYDADNPSAVLTSTADNPTNVSPIPVTAQFDESVNDFAIADIATTNCTVQSFIEVNSSTYTFELIPTGQGPVSASVPAGVCTDLAANANTASNVLTRTFDDQAPQSEITLPLTGATVQTAAFTLEWTSSDAGGTGVKEVEVFFRKQGDAVYNSLGVFAAAVQSVVFDTDANGGNGVYEFYSIALDILGNQEQTPAQVDTIVTVNTVTITFQELRDYLTGRTTLSPAKLAQADVNDDGRIDIADLLSLLKK